MHSSGLGEPPTEEAVKTLFDGLFFLEDRYDLSGVGCMKSNRRFERAHHEDVVTHNGSSMRVPGPLSAQLSGSRFSERQAEVLTAAPEGYAEQACIW